MQNLPLVSLCIPTYNAGKYFEPCLQSAIAQTYPNLEILISDDGSTDGTLQIVEKYRGQHTQIKLVQNAKKGMVSNWNNCIEAASGEWVKLLFQDDLLQPNCVEAMLNNCLAQNVEVGLCRRNFIIEADVPRRTRYYFKYKIVTPERVFENLDFISPELLATELAELLPENVLGEPSCYFFHKNLFRQTGMFDADFKQAVDMEFIIRLALIKGLAFNAEPLATFRVHFQSETSANLKTNKDSALKHIAAMTGDTVLLFYKFLHDPQFALIKKAMGEELLQMLINHHYYSECKYKGSALVNQALAPLRKKYSGLGEMKYSFFKYLRYRKLYRKWQKQNRW